MHWTWIILYTLLDTKVSLSITFLFIAVVHYRVSLLRWYQDWAIRLRYYTLREVLAERWWMSYHTIRAGWSNLTEWVLLVLLPPLLSRKQHTATNEILDRRELPELVSDEVFIRRKQQQQLQYLSQQNQQQPTVLEQQQQLQSLQDDQDDSTTGPTGTVLSNGTQGRQRTRVLRRLGGIKELEPAFRRDCDYPPGWMVFHPVLGIVPKESADEFERKKLLGANVCISNGAGPPIVARAVEYNNNNNNNNNVSKANGQSHVKVNNDQVDTTVVSGLQKKACLEEASSTAS